MSLDSDYEDGEERTIFTSGGTYYLALNTTYLLWYALLLGGKWQHLDQVKITDLIGLTDKPET